MSPKSSEERLDVTEIEKRLSEIERDLESIKSLLSTTSIEDLKRRLEDVEDVVMVENALIVEIKEMMENLKAEEIKISEIKSKLEEKSDTSSEDMKRLILEEMKALKDRIVALEENMKVGERKGFEELQREIMSKLENFNAMLVKINSEKLVMENALSKIKSEIAALNTALEDKKAILTEVVKSKLVGKKSSEVEERINNLEREVASIKSTVKQVGESFQHSNIIEELMDRISYLENRMKEIENMVKNSKLSAIIIE